MCSGFGKLRSQPQDALGVAVGDLVPVAIAEREVPLLQVIAVVLDSDSPG